MLTKRRTVDKKAEQGFILFYKSLEDVRSEFFRAGCSLETNHVGQTSDEIRFFDRKVCFVVFFLIVVGVCLY
jgi:hypothetical protein